MIISIKSFKGGVGKTTVTANLAAAMNEFKKRVLVVDRNFSTSDLPIWFDMETGTGSRRQESEVEIYTYRRGLDIMPASASEDLSTGEEFDGFRRKLGSLKYDYVLVDSPPTRDEDFCFMSDAVLVPTIADMASVRGAIGTMEAAKRRGLRVLGAVVTNLKKEDFEISMPELESIFDTPVIEVISESDLFEKSLAEKTPTVFLDPDSRPAIEFKRLAAIILGREYEPSWKARIKSRLWKK